ncbi:ROK family transcriptional regulator [Paenibacillus psychroresistens]|uniref:ROK family transcriptional regulator n=1 Tax=Paenibacillus psychroresistens TaxID=1778678 RepID=A0A6B8RV66_9BACL|nr:ROK family transcriptional regulator [Paenibacillus psychroresistens]QGQ99515.1 ROK family transcriptional regulator [Paenibacillus psychroresistens]
MSDIKPIYLQKVKQQNMANILQTIWEHEAISRVELVELTGLTSGTITNLTQELIQWGLIRESETSQGSVGRRRVMLKYHTDRHIIIGLDISRTTFEIVMTDLMGRVMKSIEGNITGISAPEQVLDLIEPHIQSMIAYANLKGLPVLGLGVSIPGPMDKVNGHLLSPPNFPGWEGYPIKDVLVKRFGLKVFIEDDARASALAERWFGLGRKSQDLVFVTMGMGIGSGVVSKGELVVGSNGLFGQVGHMTLVPKGSVCACGNEGCWETLGSIPGILRRWSGGDTIDAFFHAVHQGDKLANECLQETLYYLESALITLFNIYDPDVIILGGKLYPYLSMYLPEVKAHVKSRVYAFAQERLRIEPSSFGTSQNAIGAVALVFGNLLKGPLQVLTQ